MIMYDERGGLIPYLVIKSWTVLPLIRNNTFQVSTAHHYPERFKK